MKLRGGYDILLAGKPSEKVEVLAEPESLHLSLRSGRFEFSDIRVQQGQRVHPGQILAKDPENYSVPLLAPRAGTVSLDADSGRIVLDQISREDEEPYDPREDELRVPKDLGSAGMKRYKLLTLGAWEFFEDAHDGSLPDPFGIPRAVIVSTLRLEPFLARGDVQLHKRLAGFVRGLKHLQGFLEHQPIYLVLPDIDSDFAREVRETIRGYAWARLIQAPLRYPFDNLAVLARSFGLPRQDPRPGPASPESGALEEARAGAGGPVWGLHAEGVLAVDRALTLSRPCTVRIVSLGGPAVPSPMHLKAMPGYPLESLLAGRVDGDRVRVINGGALVGETVGEDQPGLPSECSGLTVLHEHSKREFLGFVRPGWDRQSYSKCFLSSLRGRFHERFTTGMRGELRACVACGSCEQVCPAGIMPYLIHKLIYQDKLEEVERARVDLCVSCGLCSFVCPSKIELREQFIEIRKTIREELHPVVETEPETEAEAEELRA